MGFPHSHPHMGHPALSGLHPHHPAYPYGPPMPGIPGMPPPSHPAILPPGNVFCIYQTLYVYKTFLRVDIT